jgi:sterol desaturase/sphingolipid hydroxylase (fatty acid hydroxylase superfamily)
MRLPGTRIARLVAPILPAAILALLSLIALGSARAGANPVSYVNLVKTSSAPMAFGEAIYPFDLFPLGSASLGASKIAEMCASLARVGGADVTNGADGNNSSLASAFGSTGAGHIGIAAHIKKLALNLIKLQGLRSMIFGLPFWVALVFTLTLERIIPASPKRRFFGASFAQDLIWFIYEPVLLALILATYVSLLEKVYGLYFSRFTFTRLLAAPGWIRFVVALLLLDLAYWVQHYIHHKVPFLWRLHALHHSQKELNFFTDFRYHPLEYIVRYTFLTMPFLLLSVNPPVIVGFAMVKEWYSRFYHGNIRTNLGPLKYILVTPQSHRVHHSLEEQHRDMNFGAILSIWDFLFRKQYMGFDEYPATGIDDPEFPLEPSVGVIGLIVIPWRQMWHPFSSRSEDGAK